jgi:hypothetical protein
MTRQAANRVAQAIAGEIRGRRRELATQDQHAAVFPASRRNPSRSRRAQDLARISGLVVALTFVIDRPYDMRAAEDLISRADAPARMSCGALQAEAGRLAGEIDDLGRAWEAAAEVDSNLGDDAVRAGQSLVYLASMLATAISQEYPRRAAQLYDLSAELAEAVDGYASLQEHNPDASAGIFGRLGPGIAHVLRIIHAPRQPVAPGQDTAGRRQGERRPQRSQPGTAKGQRLASIPSAVVGMTSAPSPTALGGRDLGRRQQVPVDAGPSAWAHADLSRRACSGGRGRAGRPRRCGRGRRIAECGNGSGSGGRATGPPWARLLRGRAAGILLGSAGPAAAVAGRIGGGRRAVLHDDLVREPDQCREAAGVRRLQPDLDTVPSGEPSGHEQTQGSVGGYLQRRVFQPPVGMRYLVGTHTEALAPGTSNGSPVPRAHGSAFIPGVSGRDRRHGDRGVSWFRTADPADVTPAR